ncbi:MAG: TetR/AcrR family transcriptional regulator [Flavobacteriaceae bacterium]
MMTKGEETKQYIISVAAPIFNKHGYAATSISDLTKATKLTKGAIYGNFKNKEELAIKAFDYNVSRLISDIRLRTTKSSTTIERLFAIIDFYRDYLDYSKKFGGCPILNVGVDANNQNTLLLDNVRKTIKKLQGYIATIIEKGIHKGEIKKEIKAIDWAIRLDTMIQGAVFMTHTMNSSLYLHNTMDQIEMIINTEMRK